MVGILVHLIQQRKVQVLYWHWLPANTCRWYLSCQLNSNQPETWHCHYGSEKTKLQPSLNYKHTSPQSQTQAQIHTGWSKGTQIFLFAYILFKIQKSVKKYISGHLACIWKYARYGETSHQREVKTSPMWRKFYSTPENTLILKDSLKIDPFRPKTVKTRYVRTST